MSDQYFDVYRAAAVEIPNTKEQAGRRGFTPDEIDRMDIAMVAIMLGADKNGAGDVGGQDARAQMREMARRRAKGEAVNWNDL